ncbi:aminoglycoside phosphotransferase family protein [Pseudofrankia sp. BMG5.37]|uniref:phosphotransferase family protein n=1 Tax=Pseudofrankia sp. BMG5.37 TaxID=3050035 RepID=UPI002893ADEA|nr:aminoglycoside phosphotransferase family protein [Pseudofrankia sp. BMG5.37]MDT3442603.1 aminoglycoside phosphotransferase family protein [Pseudofrankia sp. BMG5.37]
MSRSGAEQRLVVIEFLRRNHLVAPTAEPLLTPLPGGVSSDLWRVDVAGRSLCVKGSLPQLKVADTWLAPVSRNAVEYAWLRFARPLRPGQVPRVLAHDPEAGLFAMEYLPPERYPVWKTLLFAGEVDVSAARAVGDLIGDLHAASAADPASATRFATDENFDALRIEPYLRATARAHPDLRPRFALLAERTANTHLAVVHGDVSPKNILLGPHGPVLLDAECAWFGDPVFDLAFCLNHLLLKSVRLPCLAAELQAAARALTDAYTARVIWEPVPALTARAATLLPALALARVDGSSPVEYLDEPGRVLVRAISRRLLADPLSDLELVLERWSMLANPGNVIT